MPVGLGGTLPLLSPLGGQWEVLHSLADRLRELGYTEQAASQAMDVFDHSVRDWSAWPAHIRQCRRRRGEPAALLTGFFLIEELMEATTLESLLGRQAVALMRTLKWTRSEQDKLRFNFFLYPLLGSYFLTDGQGSNPNREDQVYHLGGDSHLLARLAPRPLAAAALDHCTGSGVHAVLAAAHAQRSFGVDINPRALDFARLNARWNGYRNASFVASDCYSSLTEHSLGQRPVFDLVTANPPFVPTPEKLSLCRGGGLTGEEVTEKIIRGLPQHLSPHGIFSMVTNVPVFRGESFFDRCQRWLGPDETWSMLQLSNHTWSPSAYIMSHQSPEPGYAQRFEQWLEAYESVGLEAMLNSQVYLFRSSFPWRVDRRYHFPTVGVSDFIERWISSLRAYPQGHFDLHPGLARVWWAEGRSRVYLEWDEQHRWWCPDGVWLEGEAAAALAALLQGEPTPSGKGLQQLLAEHVVSLRATE
jgi:SAM-dependent methyltransferase